MVINVNIPLVYPSVVYLLTHFKDSPWCTSSPAAMSRLIQRRLTAVGKLSSIGKLSSVCRRQSQLHDVSHVGRTRAMHSVMCTS